MTESRANLTNLPIPWICVFTSAARFSPPIHEYTHTLLSLTEPNLQIPVRIARGRMRWSTGLQQPTPKLYMLFVSRSRSCVCSGESTLLSWFGCILKMVSVDFLTGFSTLSPLSHQLKRL